MSQAYRGQPIVCLIRNFMHANLSIILVLRCYIADVQKLKRVIITDNFTEKTIKLLLWNWKCILHCGQIAEQLL